LKLFVLAVGFACSASEASASYSYYHPFVYYAPHAQPIISLNSDPQSNLNTALRVAAREDRLSDMEHFLELGAKINSQDDEGKTALMYAARDCSVKVTQLLIEHHAKLNVRDKKGRTALMYAADSGCVEVVEELLGQQSVKIWSKDEMHRTAFDYAQTGASLEVDGPYSKIMELFQKHRAQ
jgi:ankyrin repeat protein